MARRRQQQQQQQPPPTSFAASSAVLSAKATGIAASQDIGLMNQRQQRQEMHEEERKQIEVEARRMEQQKRQEEERKRTETEKAEVEDEYHHSSIERNKPRLPIIKEVLDHHGQTQARLSCFLSGIWSVNSSNNPDVFTVNFDDPTFKDVLKHPWDHPEWSMPSRINILLELLYWETKLSTTPDVFQFELFRCIHRIARKYEMIPPSLYLRDLVKEGNDQVWGGGYADIYQGRTVNGELACLKVLRVFTTLESSKQLFKEFSQEVLVWSQLEHPNILPFLGINMDLFPGRYCLVSPWCGHGSVMNYLSMHPEVDKMEIIKDILIGLQYLHTRNPPVVHGDLKGANILVSERRRCCLADFGLAGMNTLQTLSSASGNPRGSTRWMAPELFDYTITSRPSMSTDMYALGCTTLEIFTGAPPFSEIKHDAAVTFRVMNGFRPSRPAQGFTDGLWQAVERCWVHFNDRPSIQGFLYEFERIT
ncbi:kinase-like protein [Gymnopus androsaceus JB14]|uniref:Kinase-like protein n=1 Tax=Gymnopus androsaceus JB14 TaxID=1447944 RepID=A0A6A4GBT8_9AGAR|nr:kinase-like protein [Gymnopus androsaceus JB14]